MRIRDGRGRIMNVPVANASAVVITSHAIHGDSEAKVIRESIEERSFGGAAGVPQAR
jgi:hypothetical protein